MSDGTTKKTMPKADNDETTKVDVEETEETTEEEATTEEKSEESADSEEETEDDSKTKDSDNEIDYDAEIEEEKKHGKPDPEKAKNAFKERQNKRGDESESEEEDKPLTRKELAEALAQDRKERRESDAFNLATDLAGSEKEAQLVVAKWKNRQWPDSVPLSQQIREAFAITHSKKLLGERNEAVRALRAKDSVKKDASTTSRDGQPTSAPKMSAADTSAIAAAGFKFNPQTRRLEKKLSNGRILARDPKTKKTILI